MPNAAVHALGAAIGVGLCHVAHETSKGQPPSALPAVSAALAYCWGSLPDHLEPALHPNHRQFFHSVLMGIGVIYVAKKIYDWDPATPAEELLRYVALVAGGAYVVHLFLDSMTAKSLPLLGKVGALR